jgi:hypothetical protein
MKNAAIETSFKNPGYLANSDCNRDNIQASIADLVYMLRIINGEPDTLRRILAPPIRHDITSTPIARLDYSATNSLDNFAVLAIYLDCIEPLGGFCFTVKVPESVSHIGDGVLGENASNLLLASDKRSDTLKFVGYSLTEENLPQGYLRLLEIPLEVRTAISNGDFEILNADFSNGSGQKIDVAYKLVVKNRGGYEVDGHEQANATLAGFTAYPNPFNSAVSIRFAVAEPQNALVEIYDVLGRKVITLSDRFLAEGEHSLLWNGTNHRGEAVAAGVYLCRIKSQSEERTLKLNYMK